MRLLGGLLSICAGEAAAREQRRVAEMLARAKFAQEEYYRAKYYYCGPWTWCVEGGQVRWIR